MATDDSIMQTVREYADEIDATKELIKTAKERVEEERRSHAIAADVDHLAEQLTKAKADLKSSLMSDSDYNDAAEELANYKAKLSDQQDILSGYLLEHFRTTGEHQIELNHANGDARELVLKAKLGDKTKYQTNLFNGGDSDE